MAGAFSSSVRQTFRAWSRKGLLLLASLTTTYAKTTLAICAGLVLLAVWYTSNHLAFVSGRNDLISPDKRYVQLDEEYANEFMGIDQIVVVVEPRDVQQGKDFVTRLASLLMEDTQHVEEVFYRIDTSSLEGKKLLYLPPEDLRALHENLDQYHDLIRDLATTPSLNTLLHAINQQVSSGMVSHLVTSLFGLEGEEAESAEQKPVQLGFFKSLLLEMQKALNVAEYGYHSPWAEFFGGTEELSDNGYLVSENRRFVFLMVEPRKGEDGDIADREGTITAIRHAIGHLRLQFLGLDAGVTGTEALDSDETVSTQADASTATVVSLAGFILLYLMFFRKFRHPLLIVATLLVGLAWTMGFVALAVGHLTIITVFVAPMLLGLADDFGVHFLARYEEERSQGASPSDALITVFTHTVPGIIAGAFTTAFAFASVMLADFRGMQELGLIAAGGMLLCLLAVSTFLPALITILETYLPWTEAKGKHTFLTGVFTALGTATEKGRRPLLALAGVCTLGGLVALPVISFDYNLLNLQARGTESVKWEKRIIANSERSSRNALATASTPEEAMRKAAAFEALSSVETVESVASLIPTNQDQRISLVRALQPLFHDLPPTFAAPAAVDVADLQRTLEKLKLKIRENSEEWDPAKKPAEQELGEVRSILLAMIERLHAMPENEARIALEYFQIPLFRDFQDKWALLQNNLNPPGPITFADIPRHLKERFVSRDGTKFLLQIYPKKNIWEREAQEEFVSQLRQVDPDVTGNPVIGYESIRAMKEGYIEAGIYAFVAIILITLVTLRRVTYAALAIFPLVLGLIWTMGLMWLFDLQFNLANLVAVPLIIGIGVENGIHLVHRFREDGESGARLIAGSTGQATALFSLTTMVGFGSLMVARYYGIFSMGLLLTVAVGSVLVASLVILPLLLSQVEAAQSQESPTSAAEEGTFPARKRMVRWEDSLLLRHKHEENGNRPPAVTASTPRKLQP